MGTRHLCFERRVLLDERWRWWKRRTFLDSRRWLIAQLVQQLLLHLHLHFFETLIHAVVSLLHAVLYLGKSIQYQLGGLLLFMWRHLLVDTAQIVLFTVTAIWSSLITLCFPRSALVTSLYSSSISLGSPETILCSTSLTYLRSSIRLTLACSKRLVLIKCLIIPRRRRSTRHLGNGCHELGGGRQGTRNGCMLSTADLIWGRVAHTRAIIR